MYMVHNVSGIPGLRFDLGHLKFSVDGQGEGHPEAQPVTGAAEQAKERA
jgi:hypothetical protein